MFSPMSGNLSLKLMQNLSEWCRKVKDEFELITYASFPDLEAIMATRISLVRSERQREERHQIGSMISPMLRGLLDIETKCLLRLSQAARLSDQVQIALNSVVRAQKLNKKQTTDVNEEFANVLWLQKEETPAVQFLRSVLKNMDHETAQDVPHYALLLSHLVSVFTNSSFDVLLKMILGYLDVRSLLSKAG